MLPIIAHDNSMYIYIHGFKSKCRHCRNYLKHTDDALDKLINSVITVLLAFCTFLLNINI